MAVFGNSRGCSLALCSFSCQASRRLGTKLASCLLCLHAPVAQICMRPACQAGLRAKGNRIVFPAHALHSPQPAAFCPFSPSLSGYSPGSHKAWRPASDPFLASLPKVPGGQRDYGPHPELAITHALSWGFGMSKLEGPWEGSQPSPSCRWESGPQE